MSKKLYVLSRPWKQPEAELRCEHLADKLGIEVEHVFGNPLYSSVTIQLKGDGVNLSTSGEILEELSSQAADCFKEEDWVEDYDSM
jgi:hypothetical protein